MRVQRLKLENFRKHTNSTLNLAGASFVVVRGKNFAGKSSIGQALSMCFTPSTTGLASDGKGFVSKIKRGASKSVITADIQGRQHLIERVVTLSSGRTQKSICLDDPDWNPKKFDDQIEEHRVALTVALNTDAFLRMDEREQKNLLAHLALPKRYEFDREIVSAVGQALGPDTPDFDGEPFAVINQAYTLLFNERQIANRQVRDFAIPEALPVPGDSRALEDQLTTLRQERKQRGQERDRAAAEATKAEVDRVRARSKLEALEVALKGKQEEAEEARRRLEPDDKLAYLRKLAAGKDELEKLRKEHEAQVKTLNDNASQAAQLERIPKAGKNCPTCESALDGEKVAAMRSRLERQVREGKEAARTLEQKIRALGDVGAALELIAGHEKWRGVLAGLESTVADKQRQLDEERKTVPEAQVFDFQPFDWSIEECDAEIERVAGLLRPAIAAEERAKEIAFRQGKLKGLKERAAVLDRLVKYFDQHGIKAKLIGQYIGGFEAKLNEVLGVWGYSCALSIEPYTFDVTNTSGDVIPVRELSGAERMMFSWALQCAVSRTANLGLVVIDEIALLLPELRASLNRRLYEMVHGGFLEQAILLVSDTSEQVPNLTGAAFFMVEGGEVKKLCHRDIMTNAQGAEEKRQSYQHSV